VDPAIPDDIAVPNFALPGLEARRRRSIALAIGIGTAVTLVFGVQPILLGGLTEAGRLTEADLGRVATVEILALAVGSAIGPRLLPQVGMRWLTVIGCVLLVLANLAVGACASPVSLYIDRLAAGLCEGFALSATIFILVHDRAADRVNGLFLAVSTVPQMVAAFILPIYLIPRAGVDAGFYLLGAVALVAAFAALPMEGRPDRREAAVAAPIRWSPGLVAGLFAIFLHGAGIGGSWSYLEALAAEHRISEQAIGIALAGSLGCQILGASVVAWFGWRTPLSVALVLGSGLQAVIVLALLYSTTAGSFVALAWAFGFFWLALAPFQIQLILRLDPTRSAALLLTPLSLIGFSAGPMIASLAVRPGQVGGGFILSSVMLVIAGLVYGAIGRRGS